MGISRVIGQDASLRGAQPSSAFTALPPTPVFATSPPSLLSQVGFGTPSPPTPSPTMFARSVHGEVAAPPLTPAPVFATPPPTLLSQFGLGTPSPPTPSPTMFARSTHGEVATPPPTQATKIDFAKKETITANVSYTPTDNLRLSMGCSSSSDCCGHLPVPAQECAQYCCGSVEWYWGDCKSVGRCEDKKKNDLTCWADEQCLSNHCHGAIFGQAWGWCTDK